MLIGDPPPGPGRKHWIPQAFSQPGERLPASLDGNVLAVVNAAVGDLCRELRYRAP